jgi:hypothetical protein
VQARRFAAVVSMSFLAISGCASSVAHGGGAADTPQSSGDTVAVSGECARTAPLADAIANDDSSIWAFGTLVPNGASQVVRDDQGQQEVYTGYTFTATSALKGKAPSGPTTVWTIGGSKNGNVTTTDSTADFATSPSGAALVNLSPSPDLPGQTEFGGVLPATGTTVDMITIGCWNSGNPAGRSDQTDSLSVSARQLLQRTHKITIIRYHDGHQLLATTSARQVPASTLRILMAQH